MAELKTDIDRTDRRIVEALRENARMSMREIGERVHLTGQAVKNRIRQLEDAGVLQRYTINVNCPVFGYAAHALIKLQCRRSDLNAALEIADGDPASRHVLHAYRITGADAYWFDMVFLNTKALEQFLEALNPIWETEVQLVLEEIHRPSKDPHR